MHLKLIITIAFLAVTPMLFAGGASDAVLYQGKLLDFAEEHYGASRNCVNRDYTVEMEQKVIVLRENTCDPDADLAFACVIGQSVLVAIQPAHNTRWDFGYHGERIGLMIIKKPWGVSSPLMRDPNGKGRPVWLRLFKTIPKGEAK